MLCCRARRELGPTTQNVRSDFVGFTAASEAADPEDVRSRIRPNHATRLRREIERYGGTVEKFIRDAVMAVFGAPVSGRAPKATTASPVLIPTRTCSERPGSVAFSSPIAAKIRRPDRTARSASSSCASQKRTVTTLRSSWTEAAGCCSLRGAAQKGQKGNSPGSSLPH